MIQMSSSEWISAERRRGAIERKHLPKVRAVLRSQSKAVQQVLLARGYQAALDSIGVLVTKNAMQAVLNDLYADAVKRTIPPLFRELVRLEAEADKLEQKAVFDIPVELLLEILLELKRSGAIRVVSITDTTRDIMRSLLTGMAEQGATVRDMARALMDATKNDNIALWRALRITRTETTKAVGTAQDKLRAKSRYELEVRWVSANDERTRGFGEPASKKPNHWAMNGEVRAESGVFSNGLEFPGDPEANSAAEVINCRCTISQSIKKDASGKPVVKPGVPPISGVFNNRLRFSNAT